MNYKFLLPLFALFLIVGCDDDDSIMTEDMNQVRFRDNGSVEVSEAAGTTIQIPVILDNYAVETTTVSFTMEGNSDAYEMISPAGNSLEIEEGTRQGFIMLKPVDNFEFNDPLNSVTITLTDVSGGDAVVANSYNEVTVTFTDNDCPFITPGTYTTITNSGTFAGGEYTVEITELEEGKYQISDITMGLYPLGYGSADNPGVFTQSSCSLTIVEDESPDVVYGGDYFFGSGSFNGSDEITLNWANTYGDNGNTTLILQ